jgi:two-component system sensor histidine kinase PilS (NtrC family)
MATGARPQAVSSDPKPEAQSPKPEDSAATLALAAKPAGTGVAASAELGRRVARLLMLRTIVVSVVLGLSLWLLALGDSTGGAEVWLQFAIIVTTYLSSIVFGVVLRRGGSPRLVARPMLASDLAVTSLLVYLTGGAQSPYTFLYALSVVAAGAIAYRRGALVVTGASLLLATTTATLAWLHAIDLPMAETVRPWEVGRLDLVRSLAVQAAALVGVGALSVIFGDQLQRGAETLATTRRAAAELLTLHQDIVRSLSSGLITTAPDGKVVTANVAAADILRRRGEDLAGKHIDELLPRLTELAGGRGELRRADLVVPAPGHELVLGATLSPLRDAHDRVIGSVVNFQDLTELRRLELNIRRAERLATVGQLAAGIAHEIRNPLAAISGSVELLRAAPTASDDDRALMAIVHREIQRLNAMIGDLLDYANPKPSQLIELDAALLVDEVVRVARGDAAFANVELVATLARPLRCRADPAKLRQVVWNLLGNAAESGGKRVAVDARSGDEGAVTIAVADDGAGISAEQLPRIFDPFFTTKQTGTGLGLATSHAVIAEHGGRIDVASAPGRGTTMTVILPVALQPGDTGAVG